jgi:hypothetical protein
LISQFGKGDVAGASANNFMKGFGAGLNSVIDGSGLPQGMKDIVKDFIGDFLSTNKQESSNGCQSAVDSSDYGSAINDAGYSTAQSLGDEADQKCNGGKGSGNWLVALAGALSEVQAKFLNQAMENMDEMKSNTADKNDSKKEAAAKRDKFLTAQSEYQANIQMFNMVANMTATSLKSLGEGLTSIARKQ